MFFPWRQILHNVGDDRLSSSPRRPLGVAVPGRALPGMYPYSPGVEHIQGKIQERFLEAHSGIAVSIKLNVGLPWAPKELEAEPK